jgi:hypothetical protein
MELRKVLMVLLAVLRLLPRRESVLAFGFLLILSVVSGKFRIGLMLDVTPDTALIVSILITLLQGLPAILVSPYLSRALADQSNLPGPVAWARWLRAILVSFAVVALVTFLLGQVMFKAVLPQHNVSLTHYLTYVTSGLVFMAWFIPFTHIVLAARGGRQMAFTALPRELAPARAAWLIGAFATGMAAMLVGMMILRLGQQIPGSSLRASAMLDALASALASLLTLLYAIAAADFAVRPRLSDEDVFA